MANDFSYPYIGEIMMIAGNYPPAGWALCDGQLLPISQNEALFVLLGTTYGGDGQATFGLPNIQGRVPIHAGQLTGGSNYPFRSTGGVESVTLTLEQIPSHTHTPRGYVGPNGKETGVKDAYWANDPEGNVSIYNPAMNPPLRPMKETLIGPAGQGQPHSNMQPYVAVSFCISLFGLFPVQP